MLSRCWLICVEGTLVRKATIVLAAGLLLSGCGVSAVSGAESGIDWTSCPDTPADSAVRCGQVSVPVDWSRPGESERLRLRVARLPAAKPDQRIGTLVFNPGGPGGAAASIVSNRQGLEAYFPRSIRDRFDIVGIDPRGVGGSRMLRCGQPAHDPSVTRFPGGDAQTRALAAHNKRFAASCRAGSGELVSHVDTESVARDFDAVRARLGEQKVSFLGLSYGTMLAQSYAELYPHRLRALVLDGVVDRSLGWQRMVRDNTLAAQDGVDRFDTWCAHEPECALHEAGAAETIARLQHDADAGRLTMKRRKVTADEVSDAVNAWLGMASTRPELATALRKARDTGDATGLLTQARFSFPGMYAGYRTIVCQDVPRPEPDALAGQVRTVRELGPALRGVSEFWGIASGCAGWPEPARWTPHPWRVPDDMVRPLLISGAHDVATPRSWAQSVHRQLPGSTLVRWDGDGHTAWLNYPKARQKGIDYLLSHTR